MLHVFACGLNWPHMSAPGHAAVERHTLISAPYSPALVSDLLDCVADSCAWTMVVVGGGVVGLASIFSGCQSHSRDRRVAVTTALPLVHLTRATAPTLKLSHGPSWAQYCRDTPKPLRGQVRARASGLKPHAGGCAVHPSASAVSRVAERYMYMRGVRAHAVSRCRARVRGVARVWSRVVFAVRARAVCAAFGVFVRGCVIYIQPYSPSPTAASRRAAHA